MLVVNQVFPVKKQVALEGLYLDQKLKEMATEIGRSVVLTDYVTDQNGVVAKSSDDVHFQIPAEIKNSSDWGLFQELMAQADVTISSGSYFKRLAEKGAQDILYQFEPGNAFEQLGQWRLGAGYEKRSPDLTIITRHLDFELPEELVRSGRRIIIFTTDSEAASDKARVMKNAGTIILRGGEKDVDADRMITTLANETGYRVIMMASGPPILDLLLRANRLDLLYVTQAHLEVSLDDHTTVQKLLSEGKKISELRGFHLAHEFVQNNVITENGSLTAQSFLLYERKDLRE